MAKNKSNKMHAVVAVFTGVFDPVTEGHLDIIRRGAAIFSKLIIAVGSNPEKKTELFRKKERVAVLKELVADLPNVEVQGYEGLTFDFVKAVGGSVILKGIRDTVDLRYELQQANTNLLAGGIETLFMLATDRHALTSSTLIRQVATMGGDVRQLVPAPVARRLREKFGKK